MRRPPGARFVVFFLLPILLAGCQSATEPADQDPASFAPYVGWVGSWSGSTTRHQLRMQVLGGAPYQTCGAIGSCELSRDLLYATSFSDTVDAVSDSSTAVFETNFVSLQLYHPDLAPGSVEFELWSVQPTPGRTSVRYSYRGTLQGAQDAVGTVVVRRYDTAGNVSLLLSTESFPLNLRRQ